MKSKIYLACCLLIGPYCLATTVAVKEYTHIPFKGIPATTYENSLMNGSEVLSMKVDSSASFLFKAFPSKLTVREMSAVWKMEGSVNVSSHLEEVKKTGDDFPLRIGLAFSGKSPWLPFFAPSWVKMLREVLKLPSDRLTYFVMGSKARDGEVWPSPFASGLSYQALDSVERDGWRTARYRFENPVEIVGIWVMADGDQTKSKFSTILKELRVE